MNQQRGAAWHTVWTERDDARADWNGMEACFNSRVEYEDFVDRVANLVRRRLLLGPDDVVADLGCGTGLISSRIAPYVRAVVGYDYSETMLGVARRRRRMSNVSWRSADLNHFKMEDSFVTKAFSMGAFLYLDSPEVALQLLEHLQASNIASAILDVPNAEVSDARPRHYDTSVHDHLRLTASSVMDRLPMAEIGRDEFPGYVNGPSRFNIYLPG